MALKAKVTKSHTSDVGGSLEESDEEEMNNEEFNLMAKNFRKFFRRGGKFQRRNRLGNRTNDRRNKNGQGSKRDDGCFNCGEKDHFISDCPNPLHYKAFVGDVWSDDEDGNQANKEATCLMAIESHEVQHNPTTSKTSFINELQEENEELLNNYEEVFRKLKLTMKEKRSFQKELSKALHKNNELEIEIKRLVTLHENVEPCKDCENLTLKVVSLSEEVSELQQKSLNVTKLKKSGNDLNEMLNHQKVSQDKEGLGLANNENTISESIAKPLNFEKVNEN